MNHVDPTGLAIFCFGASVIMSSRAAPAGIIGKTLSVFTHSAWMRHGAVVVGEGFLQHAVTSAGRLMCDSRMP